MTELTDKKARELWALLQLRVALGDPTGELMHDELVERARDAWADAQLYRMQQAKPAQDQDVEDAIEAAYWQFDCRRSGLNEWASAPQSERDAFKAEARKLVRGYFPTRQAQDTKREMLTVADAFIRGKRAALTQQAKPVQQGGWHDAAQWLRDNYQDHQTIAGLCDAMVAAAPVQRKPLTEDEIEALFEGVDSEDKGRFAIFRGFARAIEAAHGIKGGGNG